MTQCTTESLEEVEEKPKPTLPSPLADIISDQIHEQIGRIPNHKLTKVNPLWDGHWRVNVFCREESGGLIDHTRIRHSFFVIANKDGKILRCVADGDVRKKLLKDVG